MKYLLAPVNLTKEQHEWLAKQSKDTLESKSVIIRRLIQAEMGKENAFIKKDES